MSMSKFVFGLAVLAALALPAGPTHSSALGRAELGDLPKRAELVLQLGFSGLMEGMGHGNVMYGGPGGCSEKQMAELGLYYLCNAGSSSVLHMQDGSPVKMPGDEGTVLTCYAMVRPADVRKAAANVFGASIATPDSGMGRLLGLPVRNGCIVVPEGDPACMEMSVVRADRESSGLARLVMKASEGGEDEPEWYSVLASDGSERGFRHAWHILKIEKANGK